MTKVIAATKRMKTDATGGAISIVVGATAKQ